MNLLKLIGFYVGLIVLFRLDSALSSMKRVGLIISILLFFAIIGICIWVGVKFQPYFADHKVLCIILDIVTCIISFGFCSHDDEK